VAIRQDPPCLRRPRATTLDRRSKGKRYKRDQTPILRDRTRPQKPFQQPARPDKTVRRERPQIAPPSATTGAADRRDRAEQSAGDEKRDSPPDEALFQDFVKWQLDRTWTGPCSAAHDPKAAPRLCSRLRRVESIHAHLTTPTGQAKDNWRSLPGAPALRKGEPEQRRFTAGQRISERRLSTRFDVP
jgi:hypothetical protein